MSSPPSELLRVDVPLTDIQFHITPGSASKDLTPPQQARWEALCQQNPRLFNGPILALDRIDRDGRIVHCHRDWYARFVTQTDPLPAQHRVTHLGVTGVVTATGDDGITRALLGRRSQSSWAYGGMWELGPAGGIDPPASDSATSSIWDGSLAWDQLVDEAREEAGITSGLRPRNVLGLCRDDHVRGCDLVIIADIPTASPSPDRNWEYEDIQWVPLGETARFVQNHDVIAPTLAIMHGLGWLSNALETG